MYDALATTYLLTDCVVCSSQNCLKQSSLGFLELSVIIYVYFLFPDLFMA